MCYFSKLSQCFFKFALPTSEFCQPVSGPECLNQSAPLEANFNPLRFAEYFQVLLDSDGDTQMTARFFDDNQCKTAPNTFGLIFDVRLTMPISGCSPIVLPLLGKQVCKELWQEPSHSE